MSLGQKYINWYNNSSFGKRRAAKLGRQATVEDFWGDWRALGRFFKSFGWAVGKTGGKGILGIIIGFIAGLFVAVPLICFSIFVLIPLAIFFIVTIIGSIFGIPMLLLAVALIILGIVIPFLSAFGGGIGGMLNKFTTK